MSSNGLHENKLFKMAVDQVFNLQLSVSSNIVKLYLTLYQSAQFAVTSLCSLLETWENSSDSEEVCSQRNAENTEGQRSHSQKKKPSIFFKNWRIRISTVWNGDNVQVLPLNSSSVNLFPWLCRYSSRPSRASGSARDTQSNNRDRLNTFTTFGGSAFWLSSHDASVLLKEQKRDLMLTQCSGTVARRHKAGTLPGCAALIYFLLTGK